MQIIKVEDNVFTFSPENCDGAAFWMKTGFNFLHSNWRFVFLRQCEENGSQFCDQYGFQRDRVPDPIPSEGTLHQLAPKLSELEWIYIHPNPGNLRGAATGTVLQMMLDALDALNEKGCRRIAMNGIHGVGPEGSRSTDIDREHSELMIQALHDWSENHPNASIGQVYLVDLNGGFGPNEDTDRNE
jgi:hypothetical protein